MMQELTGWEEHEAFEATSEDMELRASRLEAERDARLFHESEQAALEDDWREQQADPLRAVCVWAGFEECCTDILRADREDEIPF
jgi:hypothetical protein